MSKASVNPRVLAVEILDSVIHDGASLSTLLPPAQRLLEPRDKALLQELTFGLCRWHFALRSHYQQWLHKPINRRFSKAHSLLALGVYQLHFMRTPAHAAINETVELVDEFKLSPLKGMINAVLRKSSQTDSAELQAQCTQSHPQWMQDKLSYNWPEQVEDIFAANNARPPMTLRVNSAKMSRTDYQTKLEHAEIAHSACEFSSHGIQLTQPQAVEALPGFDEGLVSVQDEAAQLCTDLLDLAHGQRVLDACAAPGGKTCAVLEHSQAQQLELSVLALDNDAQRAERIEQNLARLQLDCELKISPAEDTEQWWDGTPFERILLDAPCSATGVIRRHPDIKLLRREGDIKQLAELQLKMLHALWKTLAEGGKLLYATCSVFGQENSRIIERFLKQEPSAILEPIAANWGIDTEHGRQLFPQPNGHDGFFYARLFKSSPENGANE